MYRSVGWGVAFICLGSLILSSCVSPSGGGKWPEGLLVEESWIGVARWELVRSGGVEVASLRAEGGGLAVSFVQQGEGFVEPRLLLGRADFSSCEALALRLESRIEARLMVSLVLYEGGRVWETPWKSLESGTHLVVFDLWGELFVPGMELPEGSPPLSSVESLGVRIRGLENPAGTVVLEGIASARSDEPPPWTFLVGGDSDGRELLSEVRVIHTPSPEDPLVELSIPLGVMPDNPYDPDEVDVEAVFVSPGGDSYRVAGFYYMPFRSIRRSFGTLLRMAGPGEFRVRFIAPQEGTWGGFVRVNYRGQESRKPLPPFQAPSPGKGYVGRSKRDPRYFAFQDGTPYIAVGSNVAWYDHRGIAAYEVWFPEMARYGANFARIWMPSWGFGIEWSDTGLGNYHRRQLQAWELDQVLRLAEENDIYVMLCLLNHGAFSTSTNPEWSENPYNSTLGGPLESPGAFVSDTEAWKYFSRRLRYIIARWGYSTHILAWEIWNETDLATGIMQNEAFPRWLEEVAEYIRREDLGRHLVTTSYSVPVDAGDTLWDSMDVVQEHRYGLQDWAPYMVGRVLRAREKTDRPYLFGEFGISGDVPDPEGIHWLDGLWGGIFSGAAGTGMLWWWDLYLEHHDLFPLYHGISRFLEGETLEGMEPGEVEYLGPYQIHMLTRDGEVWIWIKDRTFSFEGLISKAMGVGLENVRWEPLPSTVLRLPLGPGGYRVEWYDPRTGDVMWEDAVSTSDDTLEVVVPEFARHLAGKVKRVQ